MAVAITFATQTSAAGFEPQTPGSRKKAQIKQMPSAQRPAGLPEQDLCPLESVSPRPHPGKPKHLLVKVLRRGPLLAHFGIHSFTHSFTRHVIRSINRPPESPPSSSTLQRVPAEHSRAHGFGSRRSQGTIPPPRQLSKQAHRESPAVSAQEQMMNWIRAPLTWEAWTIFLKRSSESC